MAELVAGWALALVAVGVGWWLRGASGETSRGPMLGVGAGASVPAAGPPSRRADLPTGASPSPSPEVAPALPVGFGEATIGRGVEALERMYREAGLAVPPGSELRRQAVAALNLEEV